MDRLRLDWSGGPASAPRSQGLGCFAEIVACTPRVLVPVDRPDVVAAVLRRHPVVQAL